MNLSPPDILLESVLPFGLAAVGVILVIVSLVLLISYNIAQDGNEFSVHSTSRGERFFAQHAWVGTAIGSLFVLAFIALSVFSVKLGDYSAEQTAVGNAAEIESVYGIELTPVEVAKLHVAKPTEGLSFERFGAIDIADGNELVSIQLVTQNGEFKLIYANGADGPTEIVELERKN